MEQNPKYYNSSGIYWIINLITGGVYIGSTVNFRIRKAKHAYMLNNNIHDCKHLQNSYNKYGGENYRFEMLALCPREYLQKMEQWFLDNRKEKLYNTLKNAYHSTGFKHSESFREWLSNRQLNMSNETKEKIRQSVTGYKHTQETKDKISSIVKGRKYGDDYKLNLGNAQRKFSDKTIIEVFKLYHTGVSPVRINEILNLRKGATQDMLDRQKYTLLKKNLNLIKINNFKIRKNGK